MQVLHLGQQEAERLGVQAASTTGGRLRQALRAGERRLAQDGVDVSVVYPGNAIFVYTVDDRELGVACMRSYNDWVLEEFQAASPDHIVGLPMIPVDDGMDVQEAVDAPRFHQQWLPETTQLERRALSPDTQRLLEAMGHRFAESAPANHIAAILVGAPALGAAPVGRNRLYGANDPRRRTGLAAGY